MPTIQGAESNHEIDGLTAIQGFAVQPSRASTVKAYINVDSAGNFTAGNQVIGNDALNGITLSTANVLRESVDRSRVSLVGGTALTTQVMYSTPIVLNQGDVIAALTFISGATAAGTPTNWWFALYDNSATPALLAQTADQTTTAWAANTKQTVALATSQTIKATGVYWAAVMVKATTPPNLYGVTAPNTVLNGALLTTMKVLGQTSGSALTTTAPATIATPTTVVDRAYVIASTATS